MEGKEIFRCDLKRFGSEVRGGYSLQVRWLRAFRMCGFYRHKNILLYLFWRTIYRRLTRITQIQVPLFTDIGAGFYIGHCGRIIVNPKAVIGRNVNIATGCTIGQENRGKRKGAPIIGDEVWIGTNAVIVGAVRVGSDVLIAPNAYVNCDIPDHSVVFGNPCIIKHKDNATKEYVNNKI